MSSRLFKSVAVVAAGTGLSRLLGFVREMLMAYTFGTSLAKSAFDVAFRIPNLFRQLFGEGALSAAFVPVYTRTREREGDAAANRLAGRSLTLLGCVLLAITLAGIAILTLVLERVPTAPRAAAVLPLLRIMLPYAFFICVVALCTAVQTARHRFAVPALTPVILNVAWVLALLLVVPRFGATLQERVRGVAWAVLAAGALQLLAQVPALAACGGRPVLSFAWRDRAVRRVLALMGPAALGMGVHQVNVCVDGVLALWAAPWAPAALTFAERLIYLPLGVIATAMGTVLLPTFSGQAAQGRVSSMAETLRQAIRAVLLVMVPVATALLVFSSPVIELVYRWHGGQFGAESVGRTARALAFYAPGLVVFSLYKMLVPAFYALEDTRTPVRVGIWMVAANFVMNVTFVLTWPLEYKHAGLALATVISSALNAGILARLLRRRIGPLGWRPLLHTAARVLAAAALMALTARRVHALWGRAVGETGKLTELGALLAAGLAGGVVYVLLTVWWCPEEWRRLRRRPQ